MLKIGPLLTLPCLALSLLFPAPRASAQQDPTEARLLPVGVQAPDFTAQTWSNSAAHLSDYRGQVVVLDFWAPWCGPCNRSMPHLQAIHDAYHGDNVTVIGLCVADTPQNATAWVNAHKEDTFTFLLDPASQQTGTFGEGGDIATRYGVLGIPTTYIIAPDGHIAARGVDMDQSQLAAAVEALGARSAQERAAAQHMADDIKQADAQAAAEAKAPRPKTAKSPVPHRRSKKAKHAG